MRTLKSTLAAAFRLPLTCPLPGALSRLGGDKEKAGAAKEEAAAARTAKTQHQAEMQALKVMVGEQRKAIVDLKAEVKRAKEDEPVRPFRGTCNICGERGHRAYECPNKDKAKPEE